MSDTHRGTAVQDAGGWIWGLDLSSRRMGVGVVHPPTGRFQTNLVQWRPEKKVKANARSLEKCRNRVFSFARALAEHFPPEAIAYEAPMGTHANPPLVMHAGVQVEAVCAATDLGPWPVNISNWKQYILGKASAPQELLPHWAAALGYDATEDLDQLAALAVAVFATSLWLPDFDPARLTPMHKEPPDAGFHAPTPGRAG